MAQQQQEQAPERSIFGVDPLDDFATIVADWIWMHGRGKSNLEVGIMCDARIVFAKCKTDAWNVDAPRLRARLA